MGQDLIENFKAERNGGPVTPHREALPERADPTSPSLRVTSEITFCRTAGPAEPVRISSEDLQ